MDDKTRNLNTHADKEFWNNQAKKYKGDTMAVNFDVMMEELELYYLKKIIGTPANVFSFHSYLFNFHSFASFYF